MLNCLDRHRDTPTWQRDALLWESESGTTLRWTYAELGAEVSRLAAGLESLGLAPGDVIGLYLPNLPQAVAAFLACAMIGAIAMPLFSGFGAGALRDRLQISGAVALITADGSTRRGTRMPMKAVADEAASTLPALRHMVVVRHLGIELAWKAGRDHVYDELVAGPTADHPTRELPADAPLMLMYTSGTSGKPKGTIHTHIGFAAKMLLDLGLMMDLQASDRLLWMSDMGWLVGPLVAVGVPLAGATVVLADGGPDYPDRGRMWRLIEQYRVSFLGLAPTTARSFIGQGGGGIEQFDLSSLRICASTGEVWTPEAWHWTFEQVCKRRVPLLNYSGGTEVGGGILCGTVLQPIKPCALSRAIPGMGAAVVDEQGHDVAPGTVGELVLRRPSVGLTRSLWNDDERYLESYWNTLPGLWRHGDWATVDADGYWYVLGRSDDALKIAGKRTGPSEIEALLATTGHVVESAVCPYQVFPASDGEILIAVGNDSLWRSFCDVAGLAQIKDDPRFRTNADRVAHFDETVARVAACTRNKPVAEWTRLLGAAGVPNSPIHSLDEVLTMPHTAERGIVMDYEHPAYGPMKTVAMPVTFDAAPRRVSRPPPQLGEHTADILAGLG